MTTIVLVTIGIILAAASALMVLWYGGGAFDNGRINADAARLLTEGSQIERAVGLYRAQEGKSPDAANAADPLEALIDRRYLADRPSGANGRWFVDYPSGMIRADVGAVDDTRALMVCRSARRAQKLPNPGDVYRCDGADYPLPHPPGTLPAIEPCCVWTGATSADVGGGRGSGVQSGGVGSGGTGPGGGVDQPGYDPVGSTNSYTVEQRVDFLARSFDAIQKGVKAFYMKYHQISTMDQMVAMGYIPSWALTALSGDYSRPTVQTSWSQSPWPGGINASRPYVHVYLTQDIFSDFARTWARKYGSRAQPDNYYDNHISDRIYLPLFPTDVSTIVSAMKETMDAVAAFRTANGFLPRRVSDLAKSGALDGMPTSGFGIVSEDYVLLGASQAEIDSTGGRRAVVMPISNEEACRTYNLKLHAVDETPQFAVHDAGCVASGDSYLVYAFVTGGFDPGRWIAYDDMSLGNPGAHFSYTTAQPSGLMPYSGGRIGMSGYVYWAFTRENGRLVLHPGTAPEDTIAVRFTAPTSGTYRLKGVWQPKGGCGNGVGATITGLGARYADASQPWVFDFRRSMSAGQTIDFSLDNRGSDLCDGTYLDLVAMPQ